MFKPARILQAGLLSFFIAGCASTQTPSHGVAPQGEKKPITQSVTAAPTALKNAPIEVGNSVSGRRDYHLADGTLSPWLNEWAREVSLVRGIPIDRVNTLLRDVNYNATAARLMAPSTGRIKRSWVTYKNRFVEPIRIKAGVDFWQQHRKLLAQTEKKYGVPASIIVSIIGVETIYGRNTGDFRVLDALATLGFSYPDNSRPERGELFRNQLADLIQLDYQGKLDAQAAYGSYAGAMGLPQFMPGSLMRFAVDGDGDGKIDLYNSMPDIVSSVANFLIDHGWKPGLPVFVNARLPAKPAQFVNGGLVATLGWDNLEAAGAQSLDKQNTTWMTRPLGMINLVDEPRQSVEYRIATENFFAITQYNRSYFYAASVADLAVELSKQLDVKAP